MSKAISKKVFEVLVKHLVDVEESSVLLLDKYYPELTKEREAFVSMLEAYTQRIERLIQDSIVKDDLEDSCPFVIIGSIVELENLEDGSIEKYQIVSPFETIINYDLDHASVLSPVGKALLLKETMDEIKFENAIEQSIYNIKSINISDEMLAYIQKEG
jgi:transcription elongation factor GreA